MLSAEEYHTAMLPHVSAKLRPSLAVRIGGNYDGESAVEVEVSDGGWRHIVKCKPEAFDAEIIGKTIKDWRRRGQ